MRIGTSAIRISTLFAATLLAACAASGPRADRWVPPPVGAKWDVSQRNTGSFGRDAQFTVTRGDTSWKGAPAVALATSLGITTVSHPDDGRFLAFLDRNGEPMVSFDPPVGWQYPLHVGRQWTTRHRMTMHARGKTVDYDFSCKVEDYEKVTVRAGTFDAFRIHCTSTIGNEDLYWSSPVDVGGFVKTRLVRTASSPFGPGTQESELVTRSAR